MTYLLDTHAVIWLLADDQRLGPNARQVLSTATREDCAISGISLAEIALLASRNRIRLATDTRTYLDAVCGSFRVLPIDAATAAEAFALSLPQWDPFDRVIVGTARRHGLTLVTRDHGITDSGCVATLW